jgi:hypothetical protein
LGGEGFFFIFTLFPSSSNGFPMSSHMFPKGVLNSTSLESHMFCPQSSPSHLYRWAKEGGTLST